MNCYELHETEPGVRRFAVRTMMPMGPARLCDELHDRHLIPRAGQHWPGGELIDEVVFTPQEGDLNWMVTVRSMRGRCSGPPPIELRADCKQFLARFEDDRSPPAA